MSRRLKPVHPGEILRKEFMRPSGLNPNKLSIALRVSAPSVYEIAREERSVSPDMALRLGGKVHVYRQPDRYDFSKDPPATLQHHPGQRRPQERSCGTTPRARHTYICLRLMEGADIYHIVKSRRTNVEMIEKYYPSHLKNTLAASAINIQRPKTKKENEPVTRTRGVGRGERLRP